VNFATILQLESHGPDTYVGVGPSYPWGGLYGGQIVAQALRAAAHSVEPEFRVHSLHAYFIRLGDASQPIRFEVDRVRNGRTFVTRAVTVRQAQGAILQLAASFQVDEEAADIQIAHMPDVPGPDELDGDSWSPVFDRRFAARGTTGGRATCWLRTSEPIGADPMDHAAGFAYLSDDVPTDAVVDLHPDRPPPGSMDFPFFSASLDHAIWFHRPFAADQWHLHDFTCHGLLSSRGLAKGEIFTTDGTHVATVTQEVLLRRRR
jgi:acyl-CoA thioesterase-2